MWDERYAANEYVYGTEPNSFLVDHTHMLQAPILSLAEGEGRNAAYLASQGLQVHGVDGSRVGLEKAKALARSKGVHITTEVADLSVFIPEANSYGSVVSIFAHLPSALRHRLYPLVEQGLKAGGTIVLEAYSEDQLELESGGPKDLDMLMTEEKIQKEFPHCEPIILRQLMREVNEGIFHHGNASVIQFIGRKKA